MKSFTSSLVIALMLAVGANAFLPPSQSVLMSSSLKRAAKAPTVLAAKKKKEVCSLRAILRTLLRNARVKSGHACCVQSSVNRN